jgi:uncharacterized protein
MKYILELALLPEEAANEVKTKAKAAEKLSVSAEQINSIKPVKRSIDARAKQVLIRLQAEVFVNEDPPVISTFLPDYPEVSKNKSVIIIGSGPAGLFAALKLIEKGLKPIIFERGKDVQSRRRDLAAIHKEHIVNPDSNYCFGEGGAGTYSDGKLYTRSVKRGNVKRVLEILVAHGANERILVDAHPHIGTNKLPKLIQAIRQTIINHGGEFHFNARVIDFISNDREIKEIITANGDRIAANAVILATGHSARDIFELFKEKGILIESKAFALGVRIEHPQELIDSIQYHCPARGPYLPAASYSLAARVNETGVYSFCMCPGGFIVPSATAPGEVVVNGMSPSKRDSKFANSGIVVEVNNDALKPFLKHGVLAAMEFQKTVEQRAFEAGGRSQTAPAQRMTDFVNNKLSSTLPETSYHPGIKSVMLQDILPKYIATALKQSFKEFGKKMPGYFTNEAILVGVESRTSSPVRIPRDPDTLQHLQLKNLYPCGEGAGYAGGIISAAMDGEKCAEKVVEFLLAKKI